MEIILSTVKLLVGLGIFLAVPIFIYNVMVSKKNQVDSAFGTIDVYLKQRFDMIPNIVSSVQAYMKHEQSLLTQLTELRTRALSAPARDHVALDRDVTRTLGGLRVAMENYPDLKASENVLKLQGALSEVEANIAAARRNFNAVVLAYNNATEMFPTRIAANWMGLTRRPMFEIPPEERQNVNVGKLMAT